MPRSDKKFHVLKHGATSQGDVIMTAKANAQLCRAIILIVLVCAAHVVTTADGFADYDYGDDFVSDKAEIDSYSHSYFADFMPDIWIDGFLIYEGAPPARSLAFYGGFDPLMYAFLRYRFPLEDGPYVITECRIYLSVGECTMPFHVYQSGEGANWAHVGTIEVPGNYVITLSHEPPLEGWQYLSFMSEGAVLASFSVELQCTTPVAPSTWGRLKALYL